MPTPGYDTFSSIPAVKAAFRAAGHHFFDPEAMEFFNSKIESPLIRGRYFVTSEQRELGEGERMFSVRKVARTPKGELTIDTLGEFMGFTTKIEAVNYASTVKEEDSE